jgi:hypothetical protein
MTINMPWPTMNTEQVFKVDRECSVKLLKKQGG